MNRLDRAYSVFGLRLHANRSIPGLKSAQTSVREPDAEIHLGVSPRIAREGSAAGEALTYVSSILTERGEPVLRIWKIADGAFLRLDYLDGMQFWLDREGRTVWAQWPDALSIGDAATYLLGPVLGLLLRLRGVTCLHASAVAFADRAVAFVGEEGAGKSTTAAAFARRGHPVLSDDVVALHESGGMFHVLPAYPYLSLWPDSVEMLYGSEKTLPSFSENFDKRMLSLAGEHLKFEENPLPLGAVFLLGEKSADAAAPFVETLPQRESLLALVANSYATNLLDTEMRAREFELLGRLVASVPVWRLRAHESASKIDTLCDVVLHTWDNAPPLHAHASHTA